MRRIWLQRFYEIKDVAKLLQVSESSVRKYRKTGRLFGRKIGRHWIFKKSEVTEFLNKKTP